MTKITPIKEYKSDGQKSSSIAGSYNKYGPNKAKKSNNVNKNYSNKSRVEFKEPPKDYAISKKFNKPTRGRSKYDEY